MEPIPRSIKGDYRSALTPLTSLLSGFLLLAVGFFAGWYWQNASVQDVVKVEIVEKNGGVPPEKSSLSLEDEETEEGAGEVDGDMTSDCLYIGSKNSDQYHSPESGPAKRIKPENQVCFGSEEEAIAAGYEAGSVE